MPENGLLENADEIRKTQDFCNSGRLKLVNITYLGDELKEQHPRPPLLVVHLMTETRLQEEYQMDRKLIEIKRLGQTSLQV